LEEFMKNRLTLICLVLLFPALAATVQVARAQGSFHLVTGKEFDAAFPKDFYLEGNAIPTQKRNAALVKTPGGAQLLLGLLDTSGYSSQVQEKYLGMLINAGSVSVCGEKLGVGSYGFGLIKPAGHTDASATFVLYDQAGKKVCQCSAEKDTKLTRPSPLHVAASGS
jgi:hypothetical protein